MRTPHAAGGGVHDERMGLHAAAAVAAACGEERDGEQALQQAVCPAASAVSVDASAAGGGDRGDGRARVGAGGDAVGAGACGDEGTAESQGAGLA